MTTCAMSRLLQTSRRPNSRNACSIATPTTRPGTISGDTSSVAIASRPRNRPRTSAIAHSVPSTSEIMVESAAIWTEASTDEINPCVAGSRSYQRVDQPAGGKVNTDDEPNDTITVTISGV